MIEAKTRTEAETGAKKGRGRKAAKLILAEFFTNASLITIYAKISAENSRGGFCNELTIREILNILPE